MATLYRQWDRVGCFFTKLRKFRRIGTRYDKPGAGLLAVVRLPPICISLRSIEPMVWCHHRHRSFIAVVVTSLKGEST